MNPQGIMDSMQKHNLELQKKNTEIVTLATKKADAQSDYRKALAVEIARLRLKGEKVTLVETIAKGNDSVADLKVKFVIAEAEYKACLESIKGSLAALDTLRSLLTWERKEKYSQNI